MRGLIIGALGIVVASTVPASAGEKSWTGTLIDTKCYSMNPGKNAGKDGGVMANCASACAQMGIPVALLVNGKMVTIAAPAPAPAFADYMAKEAKITGMDAGGVIIPTKVIVDGKEVDVEGMM